MTDKERTAGENGGPQKEGVGRVVASTLQRTTTPPGTTGPVAALEAEMETLESAATVLTARYLKAAAVSPWLEAGLRGLISQKVAVRTALKAAAAWEADRLPFPEEATP